ncbi:hypothetical protein [Lacinutrix algicola]|uniref:hypothetical protein n=1 Tax=Lacinutrix algicola TaxID=342954 RepID=UPI0006E2D9C0|nr:hypothetical protein [Lacinutrix algicola]
MGVLGKLFGGKQKENKEDDKKYIESIIASGDGEPLAVSNSNVMYAGYNELGGYYYLQTFTIGRLKTKTKNGAKLLIEGNDYTLNLNSDMLEFECDPAHPLEGYVTKIDFEIEKSAVEKLKRSTMKQVTLLVMKKEVVFTVKPEKE